VISKATGVYIIMLVVFGAGLWAILSFGSIKLQAPTDLAGKWELRSPDRSDAISEKPAHVMSIEQSGKYVLVTIDNSKPFSMTLKADDQLGADRAQLKLVGSGKTAEDSVIILDATADANEYKAKLIGLMVEGEWLARCTARTYSRHLADQPATRPATGAPTTTHARL
jgi:hypothetical protein